MFDRIHAPLVNVLPGPITEASHSLRLLGQSAPCVAQQNQANGQPDNSFARLFLANRARVGDSLLRFTEVVYIELLLQSLSGNSSLATSQWKGSLFMIISWKGAWAWAKLTAEKLKDSVLPI